MKILLGVIEKTAGEELLILDNGNVILEKNDSAGHKSEFGNYTLLKYRPLLINREPVSGAGVFQFRYGPVTAGIREAGNYVLYTYGEKILHAQIDLTWKHRQMEQAMERKSPDHALLLAERICSNFGISHSIAFSHAVEQALGLSVDMQTRNWRILLLEMERIYNHLQVIYKLASAAAQRVLATHLSALFEEALRINQRMSGSRYLLHINQIGGLHHIPDHSDIAYAISRYEEISNRFRKLYEHSLNNPNYLDRIHVTGTVSKELAVRTGLTGPSLRACGLQDHLQISSAHLTGLPVITQDEGDSLARMETRAEEIIHSCQYLTDHLKVTDMWDEDRGIREKQSSFITDSHELEGCGVAASPSGALSYYVSICEGKMSQVKAFTPSYVQMQMMARLLKNHVFTDFPFLTDSFGVHFSDAAR